MDINQKVYSIRELTELTGIKRQNFNWMIKEKGLKSIKLYGLTLIQEKYLLEYYARDLVKISGDLGYNVNIILSKKEES